MIKKIKNDAPWKTFPDAVEILLKMRITLCIILLSFLGAIASETYSQTTRISLDLKNTKVRDALGAIENQSEFFFLYSEKLIDVNREVNIVVQAATIEKILDKIFEGTNVNFTVKGRQIVLATPEANYVNGANQQGKRVTGKVTDLKGTSVPGASVIVKGTSTGVVTDIDGSYSLSNIPENATLQFSFVGMISQEIVVGNQSTINVFLKEETIAIDEVVAIGYGTQKKINLTGSVSAVSSAELIKRPVHNVGNLLQGKVSGLQVTQNSGQPGNDEAVINIRGLGTFSGAGSEPLVLIDGVQGYLNTLSPEDIESISVLKDAASASIYGARAANGVILVTTKRGKSGELNIEYGGNYQVQEPTRMPKFVTNSADFMTYFNVANQRNNQANYFTQSEINAFRNSSDPIKYPNFNWLDYMLQNGQEQNHHISMNGGNEKTRFNVSLGYMDQKGIAIHDAFNYSKIDMRFNIDSKLNKVVAFGSNFSFNYSDRNQPVMGGEEFVLLLYSAGPNYLPKLSDGSGRWTWRYNNAAWHNRNPEQALSYGNVGHKLYSLATQIFMDINLTKGLIFEVKGAVNYNTQFNKHQEHAVPSYFYSDNSLAGLITGYNPGVTDTFEQNILTTFYSTLNYKKNFLYHNINALIGYSQESNNYRYLQGFKMTFPTDELGELDAGSTANQSIGGSSNDWALQSLFGRINYDYKEKYLFESNFRYDGSSRIFKDNRWGLFPSLSAGWRLSEESFMDQFSWINNLKLRASWGKLGNQNIGLYPYQDIMAINSYAFSSSVDQGVAVTRLTDKSLKWETTTVSDFGVDLNIKEGLFSMTADWFNKVTDNILYGIDVPASIGLDPPTVNYAKMKNTGFEFEVGHSHKIGDVKYSINLNLSTFKNEVLKVKSPSYGRTTIQEGLPWNTFYLIQWTGIFQNQAEIDNSPKQPYNPKPGDLKFKDQLTVDTNNDGIPDSGDGVIDSKDRVPVAGAFPKFYYGGRINLSWKNFDLSIFMQGVEGQKIYVGGWGVNPFTQGSAPTTDFAKNAWTLENHSNTYPAMYKSGYGPVTGTASTYFLKDASYFRLKNLMIGYNLPTQFSQKIGMKSLRIYLSGDNLATITKYPLADPERTGSGSFGYAAYPQLKVYTIGLNVKF